MVCENMEMDIVRASMPVNSAREFEEPARNLDLKSRATHPNTRYQAVITRESEPAQPEQAERQLQSSEHRVPKPLHGIARLVQGHSECRRNAEVKRNGQPPYPGPIAIV